MKQDLVMLSPGISFGQLLYIVLG